MKIILILILLLVLCGCGKQSIDGNNTQITDINSSKKVEQSINSLFSLSASEIKNIEIVHFISDDSQKPASKLIESSMEINDVLDMYKEIEIGEQIDFQEGTGGREFLVKINLNTEKTISVSQYSDSIIEIDKKYYKVNNSSYSEKLEKLYNNSTEEEKNYLN